VAGRFLDVTPEQYHRDPCERPSLSASIATELVQRSPLHAWQIHPKLGGLRRTATEALTDGTLIHALLLGAGEERIAVLNVSDFRTNFAKAARDAALLAGKAVVKAADYEAAKEVVEILKKRIAKLDIAFDGVSEQAIEWTEPTDDGEVLCRGMLDHLVLRCGAVTTATVYDVKTIRSGDDRTVQRHILDYGYDIQDAAYRSAVGAVVPEACGRIELVFVFVELEPPYEVRADPLNGMFRHIGRSKWDHACRVWARCLATKNWPGYSGRITDIEPPPWALTG